MAGINPLLLKHKKETEQVEPRKDSTTVPVPANAEPAPVELVESTDPAPAGPMNFQERLDVLDKLIQSELGLGPFTIDAARAHVKQIMIDLKEQPELDACLIDRDVHNIMRFIRTVKNDAVQVRETAKVKRETKSKKGGLGGFTLDPTMMPLDLKGLGSLKV